MHHVCNKGSFAALVGFGNCPFLLLLLWALSTNILGLIHACLLTLLWYGAYFLRVCENQH